MGVIADALKHGHDISVCSDCAKISGGEWPSGHVATFYPGECRECGRQTILCSLSDWQWPGRVGRKMAVRREL